MEWFEFPSVPRGGGGVAGGGSFFHLSFRSGSRARGACAGGAYAYMSRTEEYDEPERDDAVYTESGHMPSWVGDDAREYWDAADLFERANGRLYLSADFALPRDLAPDDQVSLAHAFAQELTADQRLPYTLAIHAGHDRDGHEHNPHAHLMISERRNDGIERSREQWFRRANSAHPERGGAPKSRTFHGRDWMEHARERWAQVTNATLERCGRQERVDHRSYERQGIDREPGEHFGPCAAHMVSRGRDHDRLETAATLVEEQEALRAIEAEIAQLETAREALTHDTSDRDEKRSGRGFNRDRSEPDRGDDLLQER
jgi:MobA/MobL family protein